MGCFYKRLFFKDTQCRRFVVSHTRRLSKKAHLLLQFYLLLACCVAHVFIAYNVAHSRPENDVALVIPASPSSRNQLEIQRRDSHDGHNVVKKPRRPQTMHGFTALCSTRQRCIAPITIRFASRFHRGAGATLFTPRGLLLPMAPTAVSQSIMCECTCCLCRTDIMLGALSALDACVVPAFVNGACSSSSSSVFLPASSKKLTYVADT